MNKKNIIDFLHSLIPHEYTCNIKFKFQVTHRLSPFEGDFRFQERFQQAEAPRN